MICLLKEGKKAIDVFETEIDMKTATLSLAALLILAGSGCGSSRQMMFGAMQTPRQGLISKEELREMLNVYRDYYVAEMKELANKLDAQNGTRRTQRTNLQMRSRIIAAIDVMLEPSDPVIAFLEIWGFTLRMRLYLEEGEGRTLYGEQQPRVIDFAQKVETEIERIARLFLNEQQYQKAYENLLSFARQNPIRGTYSNLVVMAAKQEKEGFNPLMEVISIPMAPFSAMRGVDRTADAVYQFRNTAERFTDVVKELPERAHWEALLLVDELGESPMMQSLLSSLESAADSAARLTDQMEALPALMETADASQAHIQETLKQAHATAAEIRAVVESLNQTGQTLQRTADAWERAAVSTTELIKLFTPEKPRQTETQTPPFTMHDFDGLVTNIGRTAEQIHQVVLTLQQMPEANEQFVQPLYAVVDRIAVRLFLLLLAAFVLMLTYSFLRRKPIDKAHS